jgi:outer membrane receptor protein involved in Fe transport
LSLSAGLDFDWLKFPQNFLDAPLSPDEETVERVSPKAGMVWAPLKNTVVRAAYTRSLSGASLDQSVRLEPVEVAGFLQAYRSVIPDSVAGATSGARDETFDVSLEQKLPSGTYLGLVGEILWSKVPRTRGAYDLFSEDPTFTLAIPSGVHEDLGYRERSLTFVVNQLLGDALALTARYRVSDARETDSFPAVPPDAFLVDFQPQQELKAVLQQVELDTVFNHRSGLFAQFQALWYSQSKTGFAPSEMPGDSFWQFNIFAGYRCLRRRVELTAGLVNLTDQDYRLSPLNLYNELPRSRMFVMRLQLNF